MPARRSGRSRSARLASSATIEHPTATHLAKLAIQSAQDRTVRPGRDGISYLIEAKRHGIVTPLSPNYEREILRITEKRRLKNHLQASSADDAHKRGALSEDSILLAPWARGWRTSCRAAFKWHREPFFNQDRPNVTAVGFQCSATHFRRVDFGYGAFADGRIGKVEQPALLGECHVSAPLPLELHQQFFGNSPERISPRRRQPIEPALHRGIDTVGEHSSKIRSSAVAAAMPGWHQLP